MDLENPVHMGVDSSPFYRGFFYEDLYSDCWGWRYAFAQEQHVSLQTTGNPFRLLPLFGWFALCVCHVWCGQLLAALHCAWWIDDKVRPLLEIYLPGFVQECRRDKSADAESVHLVTTRTTDRKIAAETRRHEIHVSRNVSPDHELNSEASCIQYWKAAYSVLFYPVSILAEHRLEADLPTYQRCLGPHTFSCKMRCFVWPVYNILQAYFLTVSAIFSMMVHNLLQPDAATRHEILQKAKMLGTLGLEAQSETMVSTQMWSITQHHDLWFKTPGVWYCNIHKPLKTSISLSAPRHCWLWPISLHCGRTWPGRGLHPRLAPRPTPPVPVGTKHSTSLNRVLLECALAAFIQNCRMQLDLRQTPNEAWKSKILWRR